MASFGSIVVSYHNSLLRESDVKLLQEPNWFNDNLIAFYFEYLEHNLFNQHQQHLLLLSPQVAQLLRLTFEEIAPNPSLALDLMGLQFEELNSKSLILIPVNDSNGLEESGGTHWTLLAIRRDRNVTACEHFDSSRGSANRKCAGKFVFIHSGPLSKLF
jgi:sentrin-specific protease 8